MRTWAATEPGRIDRPNEDWCAASASHIVVLDGVTARTRSECAHGVPWYVARLGAALSASLGDARVSLPAALAAGIERVAALHPECDLAHPGSPAAAVGILRSGPVVDHLVLGDVSVVLDTRDGLRVVSDERVTATAARERSAADLIPIGSAEKDAALVRMKRAELALRNRPDGYWVAAADPAAAHHALVGHIDRHDLRRAAVASDGAARIVTMFRHRSWPEVLDTLRDEGPDAVLRQVRRLESDDPEGRRWPRNKASDDATIVYAGDFS